MAAGAPCFWVDVDGRRRSLIIAAIRFVRLPGHGLWFRAHAILLAIGGIAFGLFAWQYHLLDASLKL